MNESKKRIMFLALEMDLGGLQRIVNLIIERIDKDEFIPYLCCLDRRGLFAESISSHVEGMFVLQRKPGPIDVSLLVRLYKLLKEEKIDVIHSQNGCISYAVLAGRLARVKGIVHTDHGRLVPDRKSAIIEDRVSSIFVDRFVGVSEELRGYLRSKVKVNPNKLMTILNGVDIQRFVPGNSDEKRKIRDRIGLDQSDRVLGTVCRLDPVKNLDFLIDSVRTISQTVPRIKLVVAGNGPMESHLLKRIDSLGLNSQIIFTGRLTDIENLLPAFDVYVNTSLSEGTSMTILEAMACGLPIVASAVGGNLDLVDGSNGVLVDVKDSPKFNHLITELLNCPDRLAGMGANSRKIAISRFSLDRMVKEYEDLYRTVCQS